MKNNKTLGAGRKTIPQRVILQFCTYSFKVVASLLIDLFIFINLPVKRTLLILCKLHLRFENKVFLSFLPLPYSVIRLLPSFNITVNFVNYINGRYGWREPHEVFQQSSYQYTESDIHRCRCLPEGLHRRRFHHLHPSSIGK